MGLSALPRLSSSVCGSKMLKIFSSLGTVSWTMIRRQAWSRTRLPRRLKVKQVLQAELQRGLHHGTVPMPRDLRGEAFRDVARPLQDVLNPAEKPDIQRFQGLGGLRIPGGLAGDLLLQPLDLPQQHPPVSHHRRVDLPDPLDIAGQRSVGVPAQRGIGRPVDVGLHGGGVDSELVTLDPALPSRRPGQQVVHLLPGLRPDAVPQLAVGGEVDHRAVVDAHELPQEVAVVDADDDLAQGRPFDDLTQHHPQDGVRGELELRPRPS